MGTSGKHHEMQYESKYKENCMVEFEFLLADSASDG